MGTVADRMRAFHDGHGCKLCGADTRSRGYNWGACDECARQRIQNAERDAEGYERLAILAGLSAGKGA